MDSEAQGPSPLSAAAAPAFAGLSCPQAPRGTPVPSPSGCLLPAPPCRLKGGAGPAGPCRPQSCPRPGSCRSPGCTGHCASRTSAHSWARGAGGSLSQETHTLASSPPTRPQKQDHCWGAKPRGCERRAPLQRLLKQRPNTHRCLSEPRCLTCKALIVDIRIHLGGRFLEKKSGKCLQSISVPQRGELLVPADMGRLSRDSGPNPVPLWGRSGPCHRPAARVGGSSEAPAVSTCHPAEHLRQRPEHVLVRQCLHELRLEPRDKATEHVAGPAGEKQSWTRPATPDPPCRGQQLRQCGLKAPGSLDTGSARSELSGHQDGSC